MKSKTFTSYYFLFVLTISFLLVISLFILKGIPHTALFGPGIIAVGILFHPAYIGWVVVSFLSFLISRFLKSEKGIKVLNLVMLSLPVVIWILFSIIRLV